MDHIVTISNSSCRLCNSHSHPTGACSCAKEFLLARLGQIEQNKIPTLDLEYVHDHFKCRWKECLKDTDKWRIIDSNIDGRNCFCSKDCLDVFYLDHKYETKRKEE